MSLQVETITSVNNNESVLKKDLPSIDLSRSELVLHDEDGNSSAVTQFDDLPPFGGSSTNICPAAINVENSNDVIIGPVTQFHGSVTIYQNVNGPQTIDNNASLANETLKQSSAKLVKSESTASDASQTTHTKNVFHSCSTRLSILALALILLGGITVACVLLVPVAPPDKPRTHTPGDTPNPSHAGHAVLITRDRWGGHPPLNFTKPLAHPTSTVIISHTASPFCDTFEVCAARVASIQAMHVNNGSPDIGYNFLISGEPNVYVGRGWDTVNFHGNNTIAICFIGNYVAYDHLTQDMVEAAQALLAQGVQMGKLDKNYVLVAHNQTYATLSPGANVYKVIKTWGHFSPQVMVID